MSNWRISRRHFIGAAGGALLLPLLEGLSDRRAVAAGTSDPRRFLTFYMPHGTYNVPGDEVWYPQTGTIGTSNTCDVLSPFMGNAGDMSVLKHIKMSAADTTFNEFSPNYPVDLHQTPAMSWLTGQVLAGTVTGTAAQGNRNYSNSHMPGDSFDQIYARASGKPSLVLAGNMQPDRVYRTISYLNGKQLMPITDPGYLYQSMFAALVPGSGAAPPAIGRNQSILDSSVQDLNNLKSKLGSRDQAKLDDYLTSLRDVEQKRTALASASACKPIAAPASSLSAADTYGNSDNLPAKVQAFMDMIILALKCDLVRSVSLMMSAEYGWNSTANRIPATALIYPGTDTAKMKAVGGDHPFAHYQEAGLSRAECITRDRFRMSLLMYLVNGLKGATDPSGATILDNSIVLAGYGVEDGEHGSVRVNGVRLNTNARPTLVLGGRKLGLNPGRSIEVGSYDMKDLIFTFNTYLGTGLSNFVGNSQKIAI